MDEAMANETINMHAIGYFRSSQVEAYEAGRQPDEHHAEGVIELLPGKNFEQALFGLELCSRIWIVFLFHRNESWNPMVLPPRGRDQKIGVFATRSPYRPNAIGISCVEVKNISKLKITVAGADILDGSPILDIKPYVAYADSFPGIEPAWLNEVQKFDVGFSITAHKQLKFLEDHDITQLKPFLLHQLEYEPTNSKKKRVKPQGHNFVLAYRTWRALFSIVDQKIEVVSLSSGYSEHDLENPEDIYHDKIIHLEFKKLFP